MLDYKIINILLSKNFGRPGEQECSVLCTMYCVLCTVFYVLDVLVMEQLKICTNL